MVNPEKIIEIIRRRGPILPVQLSKEIGTNILLASAHLSELSSAKKVKVSSIKVGGSPLYYIEGQEYRLQEFIQYLNDKDRKAYEFLKDKKVLRDKTIEPLTRVSLRQIKDFAKPLEVKSKDFQEIFWKWHLLSNDDASRIIKSQLNIKTDDDKKKETQKRIEEEQKLGEEKIRKEQEELLRKRKEIEELKKIKKVEDVKIPTPLTQRKVEIQRPLTVDEEVTTIKDPFLTQITGFFKRNNIEILEFKLVKKGAEYDFTINVPSAVGMLEYYCKAKSKKRISEGDLAAAFIQGQTRKMPVLVLTKGDLNKKALEMISKEFKGVTVKKL